MTKTAWIAALLLLAGCGSTDTIPDRLRARLGTLGAAPKTEFSADEVATALSRQLRVADTAFPTQRTLTAFYADRADRLTWSDDSGKPLPRTSPAMDVLKRSAEHGLDPEDYEIPRLESLRAGLGGRLDDAAATRLADFDVLLTAAVLRYASDVATGRVHPDEVQESWHSQPPEIDFVAELRRAADADDVAGWLERLPPPHPGYARLREALATLRASNDPRIPEVELNLERWRWVPRALGDPHVLVNIPAFDLQLVRGTSVAQRMKIVVGSAFDNPTPVFSDKIVSIVVNPPWNVPESIAVKEYLPELRRNRNALARQRLRVLQGAGNDEREVDPRSVDWSRVDEEKFPYHLRQDPGEGSALGRLKFDLTNTFHIYLHDTPAGHLFGRAERDLSHGCIRVERPLDLAMELMPGDAGTRLREALDQSEERHLPVQPPVQVHIVYLTAWVEEDGSLQTAPDVYLLDPPQRAAIDRQRGASK